MTWVLILAVLVGVVGIFLAILDEGSNARLRARSVSTVEGIDADALTVLARILAQLHDERGVLLSISIIYSSDHLF